MPRVGCIGGGQMATALLGGIVKSGFCAAAECAVSDPNASALKQLASAIPGCFTSTSNPDVAARSDILLIAVKPYLVPAVLAQLVRAGGINARHLVISVCAGVTLNTLEQLLPAQTRVVRVMPNTPALCGQGASGFALGTHATADDEAATGAILSGVGRAWRVEERLLDAVTGLSGSGPAYIFLVIEALADGGVLAGLPRDTAVQLAAQTALGAAKLVLESSKHPAALRDGVTSPGGTTAAGLLELENAAVRAAFTRAVRAAANRSLELGQASAKPKL